MNNTPNINNSQHPPVLVIVGPTGSGKTGLAIEVAKILNGEVISFNIAIFIIISLPFFKIFGFVF